MSLILEEFVHRTGMGRRGAFLDSAGNTRRAVVTVTGGVTLGAWLVFVLFVKNSKKRRLYYTQDCISLMEERVQRDEGKRGIRGLVQPGDLEAAARVLVGCKATAILTGFPCMLKYQPPTETDGPPGALAIARACNALGQTVYILTDEVNEGIMIAAVADSGLPGTQLKLESFPPGSRWGTEEDQRLEEIASEVDCVVAIERAGPGRDGSYYTMRAVQMDQYVAPLERMVGMMGKPSIGIGDGGNELGMGKVIDLIYDSCIPDAERIGCVVPTDYLIVASVSNWGGYALAAAIALVAAQVGRFRNRFEAIRQCLVTEAQETAIIDRMVEAGARDGITGELRAWVDGMPLDASLSVIRAVRNVALSGWWWW